MSKASNSLNIKNGTTINELEAFLIITDKLLEDKLGENPKAGIILAKGKPNEVRVRYKKAQKTLERLSSYFGLKGCFSMGICASCSSWDKRAYSSGNMGKCKGKETNWCDTCNEHSESGGGFGK